MDSLLELRERVINYNDEGKDRYLRFRMLVLELMYEIQHKLDYPNSEKYMDIWSQLDTIYQTLKQDTFKNHVDLDRYKSRILTAWDKYMQLSELNVLPKKHY